MQQTASCERLVLFDRFYVIHAHHSLQYCKGFLKLSMTERKIFLKDGNLYLKYCESNSIRAKDCTVPASVVCV